MTIIIKVEKVCYIPFFRFMLIASYFLYDIDNIVEKGAKKMKLLVEVLLIQYCSYFYDSASFFIITTKYNGFKYVFFFTSRIMLFLTQLMDFVINILR